MMYIIRFGVGRSTKLLADKLLNYKYLMNYWVPWPHLLVGQVPGITHTAFVGLPGNY